MTRKAKYCAYSCIICTVILLVLYFYPISTKGSRFTFVATTVLLVVLMFTLSILIERVILFLVLLLATLVISKLVINDEQPLNKIYVNRLNRFVGTKYVWGGENGNGIDCSGLVRKAMVESMIVKGISDLNFQQLMLAADVWWNDCTAKALKNSYRNYTYPVTKVLSLNEDQNQSLQPGDLAITFDGVHVLAYAGNNEWIEADPMMMEVIKKKVPTENVWFKLPMEIVRWNMLE